MKKILSICALAFALSACVHKMDIEQGNVMTPDMVDRIHTGMTEDQVKSVMGTPMLINTFNDNLVNYVYTYKPGHGDMTEKYMTLIFKNHRLQQISKNA